MEVTQAAKKETELWIEEAYDKLLQRFQYELREAEQVVFLWNAHVLLNLMGRKRNSPSQDN